LNRTFPPIAAVWAYLPEIRYAPAADLGLPMVGVTLVYRQGYFRQHLDSQGTQTESPASWTFEEILKPMELEGRLSP